MKRIFAFFMILTTLILVGCSEQTTPNINSAPVNEVQEVNINGFDQNRTIHNTNTPISLWVNGLNHEIKVTKNTDLREVHVNGGNIVLRLSKSHNPVIEQNGNNIRILYYD